MIRIILLALAVPLVLIAAGAAAQYQRPLPAIAAGPPVATIDSARGAPPQLPWPATGGAAVAVNGLGVLGSAGDTSPRPIASIAKVMTALLILEDRPLEVGEVGPTLTITGQEVEDYRVAISQGESFVPVALGEQLTEYELLQALLIPSGNNIAELLARWHSGSTGAFVARMNARAAELGMSNTQFADPSGVSPRTMSTPEDLIRLAQEAMSEPVFVEIVSQTDATLPVAGRVQNVNAVLGQDGIVGIKTGWTPEAGGCFLFAARYQIGGHQADVVGAVLGQADHEEAFARSRELTRTVHDGLQVVRVWSRNQVVTNINPSWSGPVAVVAADDLEMLGWPGVVIDHDLHVEPSSAPIEAGAQVGWDTVQLGDQTETVELATTAPIQPPGLSWRLLRPF